MCPQKTYRIHSLLLKNLSLLLFLASFNTFAQTGVTAIYTDWKGYWRSTATTGAGNRPDRENNLLAFTWNNVTYSTGVNDAILDVNAPGYTAQRFRALKIQSIELNNSTYILQGSMIDESATTASPRPALASSVATTSELALRLTDGVNGLSLGTGVANIKAGTAEFKIGTNNLNLAGLQDNIPDIIVTQVAEPGTAFDIFKFIDAAGNTVGNELSIKFNSINAVGTYSLDLFKADGGTNGFSPASTRDIRLLAIETKSFGITTANLAQVDRFVIQFSGSSDCAFIAFNSNSLKIAELSLVKKATMASCGKLGDDINYSFEVTNTGEVPITNIELTDTMPGLVLSGSTISSLAVGATTTLYGTYKITSTDVTAGLVTNSAKVTGYDPSLNIIEDISGTTNANNDPTVTYLLAPPTIGTVTPITCNALGSVVLNNLPSSGSWTLTRTPGAAVYNGTGTTTTIENLSAGTYTFKVSTAGCMSPSSASFQITNQSSTTWNGTSWSNGLPSATKGVIFTGAFSVTANLTACSCTINSGVNLTVPSEITFNITNAVTVATGGSLTFENNSSLLQTNTDPNINSGNILYKRNTLPIRQADYTYWSSPVKGQTLAGVSPDTEDDKYYSFTSPNWIGLDRSTVMIAGKGYIIRGPESYSNTARAIYPATFEGVPNNGTITGETAETRKFYLVGNPYPSALDADAFILANNTFLEGTLYFWTHNTPVVLGGYYRYSTDDYASYNLTGSVKTSIAAASGTNATGNNNTRPSGKIGAGQAFFAGTKAAGTFTFNNGMRVGGTDNSQFFKPGSVSKTTALEKNRVWLNMTNTEGAYKQLLVGYIEGATNGYDSGFDGVSFDGNKYLDFYSINSGTKYVIQGRSLPFDDTDTVPLGYRTTIAGDFTIAIDETDGSMNTQAIYLEDKNNGIIHDLRASNYTFSTEIGTFADRLVLRYADKTLGNEDFENIDNGILVSVKDKVIQVLSSKENLKEVSIYDITGKSLFNKNKLNTTELEITNLKSANQVLIVKVILENGHILNQKIIFQ